MQIVLFHSKFFLQMSYHRFNSGLILVVAFIIANQFTNFIFMEHKKKKQKGKEG